MGSKLLYLVALVAAALVVYAVVHQMSPAPPPPPEAPAPEEGTGDTAMEAPPALPEEEPAIPEEVPAGEAELVVQVVTEAGEPLAGATVTTAMIGKPRARRTLKADHLGKARFVGLPDGQRVSVQASAGLFDIPSTKTAKLSDETPAEVRLVLAQGGAVTGTVFGPGGGPIAIGFTVSLRPVVADGPTPGVRFSHSGRSGSNSRSFPEGNGQFSLGGVRPGFYVAHASAKGHTSEQSERFEVRQGAVTDGVQVFLDAGATISGIVVHASTGEPVAGATVTVNRSAGDQSFQSMAIGGSGSVVRVVGPNSHKTDESGRFEIDGLVAGDYRVSAFAKDMADGVIETVTVDEGRETGGLRIELGDGGSLTGTVYGPDGRPVPGAEVLIARIRGNMKIYGNVGRRAKANERGVYLVEHLSPGKYSVRRAQAGNGTRMAVSIVMSGETDPNGNREEETAGADEVFIREGQVSRKDLLGESACAIRGVAKDESGKPVRTRVDLSLVKAASTPEDAAAGFRLQLPRFDMTNEKGEFEFTGLEPGVWKVAAPGYSREFDLGPGQTEEIVVRIRPSGIMGTVFDGAGKPVAGIRVRARALGDRGMAGLFSAMGSVKTSDDGSFHLKDLTPGRYRVRASRGDVQGLSEEIDVAPGVTRRSVRIVLEEKVAVTVTVRDAAGEPVEGAWIFLQGGEISSGSGRTNAEGVAKLAAVPGEYTLRAMVHGETPKSTSEEVVIRPGAPESFELRLE